MRAYSLFFDSANLLLNYSLASNTENIFLAFLSNASLSVLADMLKVCLNLSYSSKFFVTFLNFSTVS